MVPDGARGFPCMRPDGSGAMEGKDTLVRRVHMQ